MDTKPPKHLTDAISNVLFKYNRILFAYLYGSTASDGKGNDVDLALYLKAEENPYQLSADLKIDLIRKRGYPLKLLMSTY